MVGPSRRASSWTFTKYKDGDGTGISNTAGEEGSGAVGPDGSLAAGAVGADRAVSILEGEVAGVCPEASGEGGGTISGGGPGLLLNRKIKSRITMNRPVPMKTPLTQGESLLALVIV